MNPNNTLQDAKANWLALDQARSDAFEQAKDANYQARQVIGNGTIDPIDGGWIYRYKHTHGTVEEKLAGSAAEENLAAAVAEQKRAAVLTEARAVVGLPPWASEAELAAQERACLPECLDPAESLDVILGKYRSATNFRDGHICISRDSDNLITVRVTSGISGSQKEKPVSEHSHM